jgi:hypothetical protein
MVHGVSIICGTQIIDNRCYVYVELSSIICVTQIINDKFLLIIDNPWYTDYQQSVVHGLSIIGATGNYYQ